MHRSGNRTHVLIGLWILAGLLVVGVNGFMLMFLLDEPLTGYSDAARNTDQRFRQFRIATAVGSQKITSSMDMLANRFNPKVVVEEKPESQNVPAPRPAAEPVAKPPVELPTLTGVITRRSTDGSASRLAVMDGRVCAEGDRIRDLTVKGITHGGVSLVKGQRRWFLKAPETAYSVTAQ